MESRDPDRTAALQRRNAELSKQLGDDCWLAVVENVRRRATASKCKTREMLEKKAPRATEIPSLAYNWIKKL